MPDAEMRDNGQGFPEQGTARMRWAILAVLENDSMIDRMIHKEPSLDLIFRHQTQTTSGALIG